MAKLTRYDILYATLMGTVEGRLSEITRKIDMARRKGHGDDAKRLLKTEHEWAVAAFQLATNANDEAEILECATYMELSQCTLKRWSDMADEMVDGIRFMESE